MLWLQWPVQLHTAHWPPHGCFALWYSLIPHCEICYLSCDCLGSIKAHTSRHPSSFPYLLLWWGWCKMVTDGVSPHVYESGPMFIYAASGSAGACIFPFSTPFKSICMCVSITKWPKFPHTCRHPFLCLHCMSHPSTPSSYVGVKMIKYIIKMSAYSPTLSCGAQRSHTVGML